MAAIITAWTASPLMMVWMATSAGPAFAIRTNSLPQTSDTLLPVPYAAFPGDSLVGTRSLHRGTLRRPRSQR